MVADLQDSVRLPIDRLKTLARAVLAGEKLRAGHLSIAFVGRRAMKQINRQFLKHDFDTDVLAFPLGAPMVGELVISTDFAAKEAKARKITVSEELARYVAQGILHLAG
jgi:probable rRNA maturation factor